MDINQIRRDNLQGLIRLHGTILALSKKTGLSASYLSQINNGTRNMGSITARRLETILDLDVGALDGAQAWPMPRARRDLPIDMPPETEALTSVTPSQRRPSLRPMVPRSIVVREYLAPYSSGQIWDGVAGPDDIHGPSMIRAIEMSTNFLRNLTKLQDPRTLRLVEARGDAMAPTIVSGDLLLLDTATKRVESDGIYLFSIDPPESANCLIMLKRLQRIGRAIMVRSDNSAYSAWEVPSDQMVFVLGRVRASIPFHRATSFA